SSCVTNVSADDKSLAFDLHTNTADHGSKESRFYRPIDRTYTKLLTWSMAHRGAIEGACVLVFLNVLPVFILVWHNFLPIDDQAQFEITVRAPEGSSLPSTSTLAERIAVD